MYHESSKLTEYDGFCNRYPPSPLMIEKTRDTAWPEVSVSHWCGEWVCRGCFKNHYHKHNKECEFKAAARSIEK